MAVVLVGLRQIAWDQADLLLKDLQFRFQLPVMLVARDQTVWNNAKAVAQFDAMPYLFELLPEIDELEWAEVPPPIEKEVPF